MAPETSNIRSTLAACATATALLTGLALASTASANPSHRLLRSEAGISFEAATVGQTPQHVNHRGDRLEKRSRPPVYPVQPRQHSRKGRDRGWDDRDDHEDRDGRKFRKHRRHADKDRHDYRRRGHGHRNHGYRPPPYHHDHGYRPRYRPSPWRHRHWHPRPRPYPVIIVPYHIHRQPIVGYHPHGQSPASCTNVPARRYAYAGGSRQSGGAIVGGVVGAVVGSQIGKGNGRLAAVGVGTLLGALIGGDIGRSMDAADRAYTTGSVGHALETAPSCTTITWENPQSGNYGSVTPTNTYEESPGRYCREFQQQVVIGGEVQDAYGTACRQPDGSWEIVAG